MKLIWHLIIALALLAGQINLPAAPADCGSCCAKPSAKCCCVAPNAPDDATQPLAPAPASVSAPQLETLLHLTVQFTPVATVG
ncbi:MAG: hypothetical protein HY301_13160, partial [Verrucomicrobia bacterium]|nr:hypothetical protein [Verrucomicrobiota bacterium]